MHVEARFAREGLQDIALPEGQAANRKRQEHPRACVQAIQRKLSLSTIPAKQYRDSLRSDLHPQLTSTIMLQQEVRAGFAASSASNIGLQVEMSALRAEVQHGFEQKLVRIGPAEEIAMAVQAVQQSVQKALLHGLTFFFCLTPDRC